ncbi:MAG TPA: hypothetical protein VGG77_08920, partial [Roseiarcus sp.]
HYEGMDKPHTQFEPVQLKADLAWRVRVTLPHGVQHYISFFKTEAEANRGGELSNTRVRASFKQNICLMRLWK